MNEIIFPPIPRETVRSARAVFGRSNPYLTTGDHADGLFDGLILEDPAGLLHEPTGTLARLYLITIFQYQETLPDRQAEDALRKRVDWQYALHLPPNVTSLKAGAFCEFRRWLQREQSAVRNLQTLLARWSKVTGFHAFEDTGREAIQVITNVCEISRLAHIWETLHQALEVLAGRRPDWLIQVTLPHWFERYGSHRRQPDLRAEGLDRNSLAQKVGADGLHLLEAIAGNADPELANLDQILCLGELWREQFVQVEGSIEWRKRACAGCYLLGLSPHSIEGAAKDKLEVE